MDTKVRQTEMYPRATGPLLALNAADKRAAVAEIDARANEAVARLYNVIFVPGRETGWFFIKHHARKCSMAAFAEDMGWTAASDLYAQACAKLIGFTNKQTDRAETEQAMTKAETDIAKLMASAPQARRSALLDAYESELGMLPNIFIGHAMNALTDLGW